MSLFGFKQYVPMFKHEPREARWPWPDPDGELRAERDRLAAKVTDLELLVEVRDVHEEWLRGENTRLLGELSALRDVERDNARLAVRVETLERKLGNSETVLSRTHERLAGEVEAWKAEWAAESNHRHRLSGLLDQAQEGLGFIAAMTRPDSGGMPRARRIARDLLARLDDDSKGPNE